MCEFRKTGIKEEIYWQIRDFNIQTRQQTMYLKGKQQWELYKLFKPVIK